VNIRSLGTNGPEVSAIGFGAMGLSGVYGRADERESLTTLTAALDAGVTLIDTADIYGGGHNERLVGRAVRDRRESVTIATKFGGGTTPDGSFEGLGRPEVVRNSARASLERLATDVIDIYYLHRVDPRTPVEETVGAMSELVTEGLVRYLGLSEVSPATLRKAHSTAPITVVQTEYSLFSREPEHGILTATRELGVGFVAYSPLGRGLLGGSLRSPADINPGDWRAGIPRLQDHGLKKALSLSEELRTVAQSMGVTPAQLTLAWILGQGSHIVPIPGSRTTAHLADNLAAADIQLPERTMAELDSLFPPDVLPGDRLPPDSMKRVDQ
jgi:aryl-alcohol dehydrogenase-like predicted oxidoreductase